jgi:integrase/recombinase XerC/integrase/recombinase XerD
VHKLSTSRETVTLGQAVTAYLTAPDGPGSAATRRVYGGTYRALLATLGEDADLGGLTAAALGEWFSGRWADAKPATWDTNRGALRSLLRFCETQGWIASAADLIRGIGHRKRPADRSRALDRARVEQLLAREDIALRERVLWRMLYETAARSAEVLALDVEDLDLANRRAKVRRKGGATDVITWSTSTARLLPRLLKGRRTGPVFLTERRARVELPPGDIDQASGRARLSYEMAEQLFKAASGGATLHQLRHSTLTHLAEDGMSAPMLMTKSGHTSITSLAKYARPSADALARWEAERDPARRR